MMQALFNFKSIALTTALFASSFGVHAIAVADELPVEQLRPVVDTTLVAHKVADAEEGDASDLDKIKKENSQKYSGGAPLKTNPEMEELMKRAELFAADKSFRNATLLWQRVLEKSGDSLYTVDGETYYSLAREVERRISKLPADGMRVYRVGADGETKAVLAEADGPADQDALSKIVDNYFLSSLGDEAAFDLGCLALDAHDFVGASRLFTKIIDEYPEPTVSLDQVYLRLALATAHIGDAESANNAIKKALELSNDESADLVKSIAANIETFASGSSGDSGTATVYSMRLANPNRIGVMPAPPENALASDLTPALEIEMTSNVKFKDRSEIKVRSSRHKDDQKGDDQKGDDEKGAEARESENEQKPETSAKPSTHPFAKNWKDREWTPTGQILVGDDQLYFRTHNDIVSWPLGGESEKAAWKSLWLNKFEPDKLTTTFAQIRKSSGQTSKSVKPSTVDEVFFFGDRIRQSMLVHEGVLYAVEGKSYSRFDNPPGDTNRVQNFNVYNGTIPRRSRTNSLTAYDAATGKLLWYRTAADINVKKTSATGEKTTETTTDESVSRGIEGISFMAAPVPYGNLLICPVSEGGAIWVYGIDRTQKGKTIWKSYLCDEPGDGCNPWSPIEIAVEGRDAYVVCGTGAVFALDAVSGMLRFARRYVRDTTKSTIARRSSSAQQPKEPVGWSDDIVIPYGNALIVMASDHDRLFAIDRRSGEFIWEAPRRPLDDDHPAMYCLGVYNDKMYVGGPKIVICYDLAGEGRLRWVKQFDKPSLGRGFVCSNGVYVPVDDSIMRIDLDSDKVIKQVGVKLQSGEPVGNLYSDGKRIWVMGANKIYALTNIDQQIDDLGQSIQQGSTSALIQRMQLYASMERFDKSIGDLDSLLKTAAKTSSSKDYESVFNVLDNTEQFGKSAAKILQTLEQHQRQSPSEPLQKAVEANSGLLREYAELLSDQPRNERLPATLAASQLLTSLIDRTKLASDLADIASPEDLDWLKRPAPDIDDDPGSTVVTLKAIARLSRSEKDETKLKESFVATLQKLQKHTSEQVRYAAAYELIDAGERTALPTLIELLVADDNAVRSLAGKVLLTSTQQRLPVTASLEPDQRKTAADRWQKWLDEEGDSAELKFPVTGASFMLGRTLVCSEGSQRIIEYLSDEPYTEVWTKKISGARYASGDFMGNRVVAQLQNKRVVRLDKDDNLKVIYQAADANPSSVQQLENGNVLISLMRSKKYGVIEVDGKGKVVWNFISEPQKNIMHAVRLENGNTLICLTTEQKVVEVNPDRKVVWELENVSNPYFAQRLKNGNTLICEYSTRRVREFNSEKKSVWSKDGVSLPQAAIRLANGNTLIGHQKGLTEFDSDGQVVRNEMIGKVTSINLY